MVDTLTLSPEEKAAREAQRAAGNRVLYAKVALGATVTLVALLVLMKVFAALWLYGIAPGGARGPWGGGVLRRSAEAGGAAGPVAGRTHREGAGAGGRGARGRSGA
jgi:hypothetical protein